MKDRMTQYPHSLKLKCEAMVENKDFYPVASRATGFKNPGAHWPTAISSGPLMAKFTLAAFLKVGVRGPIAGGPWSYNGKRGSAKFSGEKSNKTTNENNLIWFTLDQNCFFCLSFQCSFFTVVCILLHRKLKPLTSQLLAYYTSRTPLQSLVQAHPLLCDATNENGIPCWLRNQLPVFGLLIVYILRNQRGFQAGATQYFSSKYAYI